MSEYSLQRAELASVDLVQLCRRSIEVIEAGQASTGAYLASPSFPVYRYSWFRDGAFIADAMSRVGRGDSAERFFAWCSTCAGRASPPKKLRHCCRGEVWIGSS